MSQTIRIQPLTTEAFAPYGDVLKCDGVPDKIINGGMCGRFHDLAIVDVEDGRAGIYSLYSPVWHTLIQYNSFDFQINHETPLDFNAFLSAETTINPSGC